MSGKAYSLKLYEEKTPDHVFEILTGPADTQVRFGKDYGLGTEVDMPLKFNQVQVASVDVTGKFASIDSANASVVASVTAEASSRASADTALDSKIASETTRASGSEQANAVAIGNASAAHTAYATQNDAKVDAEIAARVSADAAEAVLRAQVNTDLLAELAVRANADLALDQKIVAEASTARSAEQANASSISTESTRALAAEGNLQTQITSLINGAPANLDSLAELITRFDAADLSIDNRMLAVEAQLAQLLALH